MSLSDIKRIRAQQAQPRSIELYKAMLPLRSCIGFMNTGAHPDDETTSMLAVLGIRDGINLSHACSTRGEGGQNALGVETIHDLGTLRTREMERAADILDISQYWLSQSPDDPIFDFGFSKSGEETLANWGESRTLERFVFILRSARPDIICPTFLDVPGQHGHHRAMTQCAFKAVILAADPKAFPEQQLDIWQVKKLYLPAWSGAGDSYDDDLPPPPATVVIDGTGGDPVYGADYAQIAQWSRGYHATQGMGVWVKTGAPNVRPLNLAWVAQGEKGEEDFISDGLPKTLADLAAFAGAPALGQPLSAAQSALEAVFDAWPDAKKMRGFAGAAMKHTGHAVEICPEPARAEVLHRLAAKQRQLTKVIALAGGIEARLSVSQNQVRAGDTFTLSLDIHTPDQNVTPVLSLPEGWSATPWKSDQCEICVGNDAQANNPYPDTWFPDRANGALHVALNWDEGAALSLDLDVEENLNVLPAVSADLSQAGHIVNIAKPAAVSVMISRVFPLGAQVDIAAVAGWGISQNDGTFTLTPAENIAAGLYEFPVMINGQPAQTGRSMGYDHTGELFRFEPAILRVRVLDVTVPTGRIAYIGGGSDQTDIWLRNVGMNVITLDDAALEHTDFGEFDAILVGIFALRTRPILAARLSVLHDWVRAGGNLVTLYHRPWDNWDVQKSALAMMEIGKPSLRWRVTDQNAEVTHLQPDHPLLNTPNTIGPRDWADWKKERGLYFASNWDAGYTPLFSMTDPDEDPHLGSLLTGTFGQGRHTHTSLILHHQVEKLVPGAFRILANLLQT